VGCVGDDESAFDHRSARFNMSIDAARSDPAMDEAAMDEAAIGWARTTWEEMRPFSNGSVYMNFSGLDDEAESLRATGTGVESGSAGGDPSYLRSGGIVRGGGRP
jgi:hypothetical protein